MTEQELVTKLEECFIYNSETGEISWKVCAGRWKTIPVGTIVGYVNKNDGRKYLRFNDKLYSIHRLAWLFTHGRWPNGEIDHIDGNPLNNRIDNLRDVDSATNKENTISARKNNKCNLLGVSFHSQTGKFRARIQVGGKQKHIGLFDTPEEAHAAYITAKRKLHKGCTI